MTSNINSYNVAICSTCMYCGPIIWDNCTALCTHFRPVMWDDYISICTHHGPMMWIDYQAVCMLLSPVMWHNNATLHTNDDVAMMQENVITCTWRAVDGNAKINSACLILIIHVFLKIMHILCFQDYTFFRRKFLIMVFNYCSFGLAVYFFFRHNSYCEPGGILLNLLTLKCTML